VGTAKETLMTNRQANCYGKLLFLYSMYVGMYVGLVVATLGCAGCGNGDDDDGDCDVTNTCPDGPDAGSDVDAYDATPDADTTTPDGNTASCAEYVNVPSDGWLCSVPNNPTFDMNGLTFVVEDGACHLSSDSFWCQDPPPATDVQRRQFTCTANNGAIVTCWHN